MKRLTFRSSFGENIEAGSGRFFQKEKTQNNGRHLFVFYLTLFLSLGFLIIKLGQLQILQGRQFLARAERNRLTIRPIPADRGIIFDRDGRELARNVPGFSLSEKSARPRFLSFEEALRFSAAPFGGAENLVVDNLREYPLGPFLTHVLGFVGEISQEELEKKTGYRAGDKIGRGGIEEAYEWFLRGIDGREFIETDVEGKKIRSLQRQEPAGGKNLTITLDSSLQGKAARAVEETLRDPLYSFRYTGPKIPKGAIIVTKISTGEVLVLYSFPSFDPNLFTKQEGLSFSTAIFSDINRPLFNRAISGRYPPGSTFKIITAGAGLEGKFIKKTTLFEDTGIIAVGSWKFPNWLYLKTGKTDGRLNVTRAIIRSNDIFFYKTAEAVGLNGLRQMAKKFGLGKPLGIDLPGEEAGLVPDEEWKKEEINEDWYLGDTYHLGIGQGYLLVTPLQVNHWTRVIGRNGKRGELRIAEESSVIGHRSSVIGHQSSVKDEQIVSPETADIIKEGMIGACQEGGTGWPFFKFKVPASPAGGQSSRLIGGSPKEATKLKDIRIACKTGTAEFGDPKGRAHAWFTAFSDEPEGIVVTVLVEEGGEGSDIAAPVAKKIFEEWYKN